MKIKDSRDIKDVWDLKGMWDIQTRRGRKCPPCEGTGINPKTRLKCLVCNGRGFT
jgi:DnaJ-class molecular chaperone